MSDSQATARRFDQRRKRKADRVRLRGTRATKSARTVAAAPATERVAPSVGAPAVRAGLATRLLSRGRGAPPARQLSETRSVRPAPASPAVARRPVETPPQAPPNVLAEFRGGFDRINETLREGLGLTSRSELDALEARNAELERTVADQQAVLQAKDAELDALRHHLAGPAEAPVAVAAPDDETGEG